MERGRGGRGGCYRARGRCRHGGGRGKEGGSPKGDWNGGGGRGRGGRPGGDRRRGGGRGRGGGPRGGDRRRGGGGGGGGGGGFVHRLVSTYIRYVLHFCKVRSACVSIPPVHHADLAAYRGRLHHATMKQGLWGSDIRRLQLLPWNSGFTGCPVTYKT